MDKKTNRLTEIANKCGTDKGQLFDEGHEYTRYYDYFLSQYTNPKILEIGAWHGASTRMFNEYYNGQCEIWTVDIDYSPYGYEKQPNIHNEYCNQNLKDNWDAFFMHCPDKYDIIIDDGSHKPEHQMHTLGWLWNHINKDGIYILEDLHTYMWDQLNFSPLYFLNFWNRDNQYISAEQFNDLYEHLDDVMIFHRRNKNTNYCGRSITSILRFN